MIDPTLVTSGGTSTDATSYNTASVTPPQGEVYYVGFMVADQSGNLNSTAVLSGWGLTWVQERSAGNTSRRLYVFRASGTPTSGVLTLSSIVSTGNADGADWLVLAVDGVDQTSNDGVVQSKQTQNALTSISITMDAAIGAGNASCGFFGAFDLENAAISFTAGDGYTEVADRSQTMAAESVGIMFCYRHDGNTVVDASTIAGANGCRVVAMEIAVRDLKPFSIAVGASVEQYGATSSIAGEL